MAIRFYLNPNSDHKVQLAFKGIFPAFLFTTLFAGVLYSVLMVIESLNIGPRYYFGAYFAYLTGNSLFVREEILKVVRKLNLSRDERDSIIENLAAICYVSMVSYIAFNLMITVPK